MDRLKLVNTTRDIPLNLYNPDTKSELHMRKVLLGYRHRAAIRSSDGAPPLYYRWIHEDEWYAHHDMPPLQSYACLNTVFSNTVLVYVVTGAPMITYRCYYDKRYTCEY